MEYKDSLIEQIKTVQNLCSIALLLCHLDREELLPTILEILLAETQDIVDEYCVVGKLD